MTVYLATVSDFNSRLHYFIIVVNIILKGVASFCCCCCVRLINKWMFVSFKSKK